MKKNSYLQNMQIAVYQERQTGLEPATLSLGS